MKTDYMYLYETEVVKDIVMSLQLFFFLSIYYLNML